MRTVQGLKLVSPPSALASAVPSKPRLQRQGASRNLLSDLRATLSEGGNVEKRVDYAKVGTWFGATVVEVALLSAAMFAVQTIGGYLPPIGYKCLAILFFASMALKSRIFSILDASRPTMGEVQETKRPSWTPPPIVFPIVWSTIGILRTVSSVVVWEAVGRQMLVLPLIAMMTHLSIGDTWNNINNVERRKGSAVAGVAFVWTSVVTCTYLYWQTIPLAGMILAPSVLWLSIASVLIFNIWKLNGYEPILPYKSD
ncbi:hypothetical protein GUITHDRAFT_69647 [Guillardia theta CCMP2712]|uniref:Uncharacterized protein n=1 Tax=Guillardia theta (strain CCMP2712) TaxID=905079 RepID=L1JGW3_GUITC|nr:hypothetical protein GUITHDRAFT_69647 [Guillardia theta CCMP2712]EKX47374.1 hypothetical protein GUITHDRAFT_69647 [Guillardia theta CCMP2712]|eukprot:XP_005834354.1 hypothetical protein GUITHDRAFT_69647 [Guillardia theta CCMP2712]